MTTIYEPLDNSNSSNINNKDKYHLDLTDPETKEWFLKEAIRLLQGIIDGTSPEKLPDEIEF